MLAQIEAEVLAPS
jgi:hypothetical protein